jgi:hypothetical protein
MTENQLISLQESFKIEMSEFNKRLSKFDLLQSDEFRKLKSDFENFTKSTQNTLKRLLEDVRRLENQVDTLEAAQKGSSLLIHGLKEGDDVKLECDVVDFLNSKVSATLLSSNIAAVYRLGKKSEGKPRPVVVQFDSLRARRMILTGRSKLKGSPWLITDFLTARRLLIFKEARKLLGMDAWAASGKIFIKIKNKTVAITHMRELDAYKEELRVNKEHQSNKPASTDIIHTEKSLRPRKAKK